MTEQSKLAEILTEMRKSLDLNTFDSAQGRIWSDKIETAIEAQLQAAINQAREEATERAIKLSKEVQKECGGVFAYSCLKKLINRISNVTDDVPSCIYCDQPITMDQKWEWLPSKTRACHIKCKPLGDTTPL